MNFYNPFASLDEDDLVLWSIRAFYVLAAYAIIIVRFIPDLRLRFLDYGARSSNSKNTGIDDTRSALPRWFRVQFDPVLDYLASLTVPHGWFTHFYLCSTVCSAFWLSQNVQMLGDLLSTWSVWDIFSWQGRTLCAMLLLQAQGLRRLYECIFIAKASTSRMWVGHYLIGIAFYIATNIAVWIEPALGTSTTLYSLEALYNRQKSALAFCLLIMSISRIALGSFFFIRASQRQHTVHKYLASLKEYRVPDHPIFQKSNVVCPHYESEIHLYLILALMTGRDDKLFNITMLCAVSFVIINLGVTADLTQKWQLQRFPKQRLEIAKRSRMLGRLW